MCDELRNKWTVRENQDLPLLILYTCMAINYTVEQRELLYNWNNTYTKLFYQKSLSIIKINSLISGFQLIYILLINPKHKSLWNYKNV